MERLVPVNVSKPGTTLTVAIPAMGERTATVMPMPFIDPKRKSPRPELPAVACGALPAEPHYGTHHRLEYPCASPFSP